MVSAQNAVVQRAARRPPAGNCETKSLITRYVSIEPHPVARDHTVVQRAARSPAALKGPVARNHTVGNHRVSRFTPQPAADLGRSIGQSETREAGPVGQVHAPNRSASVESRKLR